MSLNWSLSSSHELKSNIFLNGNSLVSFICRFHIFGKWNSKKSGMQYGANLHRWVNGVFKPITKWKSYIVFISTILTQPDWNAWKYLILRTVFTTYIPTSTKCKRNSVHPRSLTKSTPFTLHVITYQKKMSKNE